jgi:hypothetical protein
MNPYRVLVCGGRTYGTRRTEDGLQVPDEEHIATFNSYLDSIRASNPNMLIIQGGAKGADALAKAWAKKNNVECIEFRADWDTYGKAAGFLRNVEMLEVGQPDLVIGFPGSTGTAMMCKIASAAGVEVRKVK